MPFGPIGLAVALAVAGLVVGYASAMSFLAPTGRLASGLVGACVGLALARALWLTRHGEGPLPGQDEESTAEPVEDEPRR